ncbi:MAG: protein kinase [Deltaproteobacteria bacterium]|nr:protein kinase [Deltaproteobacteria bacterium]
MSERFQLCELLGAGSTGKVYRARDEELGKDVALKMLRRPDLVEDRLQLKEEFRSVAGILHPNLVELYELVVEPERSFFTMELLDGAPYSDVAQRRGIEQVDSGRFADELRQMVLGLSALHAGGCVHRDIKPSNVFLTRSGRVVIVDFGLSAGRRVPSGSKRREIAGTLAYVAPEVLWGEPCTTASDLYGLGALAYEALSGSPPFQGHPVEILDRKMRGELEPIRAIRPDLDTKVGDLVMSLLDPKQQERPTATEVLAVLDALAPAEIAPRRAPVVFRDSPFVGRELELGQFSQAAARASEEGLQVVSLSGPSGIGKSELLKRAVGQLVETHLVLFGRCHPFESVPYNAFDAVVSADRALYRRFGARGRGQRAALRRAVAGVARGADPRRARVSDGEQEGERVPRDCRESDRSAGRRQGARRALGTHQRRSEVFGAGDRGLRAGERVAHRRGERRVALFRVTARGAIGRRQVCVGLGRAAR